MAKFLIITGVSLVLIGLLLSGKVPLGRLPGDFSYHRGNFHLFFPLTTSIILSLILTLLLLFFSKR